jgi:hypothetical protein
MATPLVSRSELEVAKDRLLAKEGSPVTSEQTLDRLYRLLGDAVLLPIPLGKKGPQETGWQNLTFDQHKERDPNLSKAINRGGNIGVLLGPKSNRLFAPPDSQRSIYVGRRN